MRWGCWLTACVSVGAGVRDIDGLRHRGVGTVAADERPQRFEARGYGSSLGAAGGPPSACTFSDIEGRTCRHRLTIIRSRQPSFSPVMVNRTRLVDTTTAKRVEFMMQRRQDFVVAPEALNRQFGNVFKMGVKEVD